jgi:hypothetical protein
MAGTLKCLTLFVWIGSFFEQVSNLDPGSPHYLRQERQVPLWC